MLLHAMRLLTPTATLAAACLLACGRLVAAAPPELDAANVVWNSPSENAAGSMPLGNGEAAINLWVEPDGDLLFYVARTDAWREASRLLKLGRVRIRLEPNPFAAGQSFRQELVLRDGQAVIHAGDAVLRVFVDADAPVIYVDGRSATPRTLAATFETWRTERRVLKGEELNSSHTMRDAPDDVEVWESADVVVAESPAAILAYHRNAYSVAPLTLRHQGLESLAHLALDPLANRTFGVRMTGRGMTATGDSTLRTARPATEFSVTVATHAAQTASLDEWTDGIPSPAPANVAAARTAAWWNAFWNRSWIVVEPAPPTPEPSLTQAYVLQRWITACAGRGRYPIKFNGSLFTVEPRLAGGPDFNPDWRRWGDCYWWQNTRLPYFPMIARGDFDQLAALFRFYRQALPLCEARAQLYHGVAGAYFPETMTPFGAYANFDYGWRREGRPANEVLCPWWQYVWQQGLELTALMLDYYEHVEDEKFLADELIPMASAVLRYYDARFPRNSRGQLVISPTQAVETYWDGVVNDAPSVAGLADVTERLLRLPAPEADRALWQRVHAAAPPLSIVAGRIQPAESFQPRRRNVENPELYALWPFRRYGVGRPDLAVGVDTFLARREKASVGWQYDGQCAAAVGLADEAGRLLLGKLRNSHPQFRFPVMWGPNYDWLPDQDHGSSIMLTLQAMVLRTDGPQIFLLPAWPKAWNVSFRLHAPMNTTVEGVYRNGVMESLHVTPPERRKDIVACWEQPRHSADAQPAELRRPPAQGRLRESANK